MTSTRIPALLDDFAIPPGETLREILEQIDMSQADLARRTGLTPKHVNQVVQGLAAISADVALRLERVTGVSARTWLRLEADYRGTLTRNQQRQALAPEIVWAKSMPVAALVKLGRIADMPSDWISRVEQLLGFFGVATVDAYQSLLAQQRVSFKQSIAHQVDESAVAAWLRIGELEAQKIHHKPFSGKRFEQVISSARVLSTQSPRDALPQLVSLCASAGVALVFVPEIAGARAYGATRWLANRRPLIQLSTRGKTIDALWLSFAHEAAHVLMHEKRTTFVDSRLDEEQGELAPEEVQADDFAFRIFIPADEFERAANLTDTAAVVSMADELGIDPGILVARLHRTGAWRRQEGVSLRRKLRDSDIPGQDSHVLPPVNPDRLTWSLPGIDR